MDWAAFLSRRRFHWLGAVVARGRFGRSHRTRQRFGSLPHLRRAFKRKNLARLGVPAVSFARRFIFGLLGFFFAEFIAQKGKSEPLIYDFK